MERIDGDKRAVIELQQNTAGDTRNDQVIDGRHAMTGATGEDDVERLERLAMQALKQLSHDVGERILFGHDEFFHSPAGLCNRFVYPKFGYAPAGWTARSVHLTLSRLTLAATLDHVVTA